MLSHFYRYTVENKRARRLQRKRERERPRRASEQSWADRAQPPRKGRAVEQNYNRDRARRAA